MLPWGHGPNGAARRLGSTICCPLQWLKINFVRDKTARVANYPPTRF